MKEEDYDYIFTFNMFPQIGLPAKWLKQKYGVQVISLLADLPIDDRVNRKGISKFLRKWFDTLTKKTINFCDKIIVLNKNAAERFAPNTDYIIIDGGININEYDSENS